MSSTSIRSFHGCFSSLMKLVLRFARKKQIHQNSIKESFTSTVNNIIRDPGSDLYVGMRVVDDSSIGKGERTSSRSTKWISMESPDLPEYKYVL